MAPVIIVGEPGVGKTSVAKAIHALSSLKTEDIRVLNMMTLTPRDQRIALFGAVIPEIPSPRRSILEFATTVVLKHVNVLEPYCQERLAQALDSSMVQRLGEKRGLHIVNARVMIILPVSPTELAARKGLTSCLRDLFASYPQIVLPPLRERKAELESVLKLFAENLEDSDRAALLAHPWTDNFVELRAHMQLTQRFASHAEALGACEQRELQTILLRIAEHKEFSLKKSLQIIECGLIRRALESARGQSHAARLLGITDREIRSWQKKMP
jgi:DNA-binding NtrC family response regulator